MNGEANGGGMCRYFRTNGQEHVADGELSEDWLVLLLVKILVLIQGYRCGVVCVDYSSRDNFFNIIYITILSVTWWIYLYSPLLEASSDKM